MVCWYSDEAAADEGAETSGSRGEGADRGEGGAWKRGPAVLGRRSSATTARGEVASEVPAEGVGASEGAGGLCWGGALFRRNICSARRTAARERFSVARRDERQGRIPRKRSTNMVCVYVGNGDVDPCDDYDKNDVTERPSGHDLFFSTFVDHNVRSPKLSQLHEDNVR